MRAEDPHYCEGRARLRPGSGFFRPGSRPARDLGVLLARQLVHGGHLSVLDLMAGCGIRSLRYVLEAGATELRANDADPERLPLLREHLLPLADGVAVTCSGLDARRVLVEAIQAERRYSLIDLDAFGCPAGMVPLTLEALAPGGVLYLTCSDARSATGHDRSSALRRYGASARVHPASWEMALRLQLGMVARSAWATGRGINPLFSFSDGRTFRTAIELTRSPLGREERLLGLVAYCPLCGDQQVQSLWRMGGWSACLCPGKATLPGVISGPLWIGALQCPSLLGRMRADAAAHPGSLSEAGSRILARLTADPGNGPCCWPLSWIGRRLGQGPPSRGPLIEALQRQGHRAWASGIMPGQLRCDASWATILDVAAPLVATGAAGRGGSSPLNREAAR